MSEQQISLSSFDGFYVKDLIASDSTVNKRLWAIVDVIKNHHFYEVTRGGYKPFTSFSLDFAIKAYNDSWKLEKL